MTTLEFYIKGLPRPEPKKDGAMRYLRGGGTAIGTRKRDKDGSKAGWVSRIQWDAKIYMNSHSVEMFPQYTPLYYEVLVYIKPPKNQIHKYPVIGSDDDNYYYLVTNALKKICYHDDCMIIERYHKKLYADDLHPPGISIKIHEID